MRSVVGISLVLGLALSGILGGIGQAQAHANLVRGEPQPNAVIPAPPSQVRIWFSEELEPGFSEVLVLDKNQARADKGDSHLVEEDRTSLATSLKDIPEGTYTVVWKALSAVDGHITKGAYSFTVGEAPAPGPTPGELQTSSSETQPPTLLGVLGRWLSLLGALVLIGGFALRLVAPTSVQGLLKAEPLKLALLMLAVGEVTSLLLQTASVFDLPFYEAMGPPLFQVLGQTRYGLLWMGRFAVVILLAAVLLRLRPGGSKAPLGVGLALGGPLFLSISLFSHAAANSLGPLPLLADWLHLWAAALWIGGLVSLACAAFLASHTTQFLSALVQRFSWLAAVGVVFLVITGLYSAWVEVRTLAASPYSLILLAKAALLLPVLFLGAVNLLHTRPNLAAALKLRPDNIRYVLLRSRTLIGMEALLGIIVVAVAALLIGLPPTREALGPAEAGPFKDVVLTSRGRGLWATLRVTPGTVGPNAFTLLLTDAWLRPVTNARVTLQFDFSGPSRVSAFADATPWGEGRYIARGSFLSIVGPWRIFLYIRQPDGEVISVPMDMKVSETAPASRAPLSLNRPLLLGLGILSIGLGVAGLGLLLFLIGNIEERNRLLWKGASASLLIGGVAIFLSGGYLTAQEVLNPTPQSAGSLRNPIPADTASLAIGKAIYTGNCLPCHGEAGQGDGPLAKSLYPPPVDLRQHVGLHPEGDLFLVISKGLSGTDMPAFEGQLTEEERWHVLNYIRSFAEGNS